MLTQKQKIGYLCWIHPGFRTEAYMYILQKCQTVKKSTGNIYVTRLMECLNCHLYFRYSC